MTPTETLQARQRQAMGALLTNKALQNASKKW